MWSFFIHVSFLIFFAISGLIWNIAYFSARDTYKRFPKPKKLQRVSLLFPVYREKYDSIWTTVKSVITQDYSKKFLEVIFITEPDDVQTQICVKKMCETLKNHGIVSRIVVSDGKKKIKAHALNFGLKVATGEVIGILDADDALPPDYISQAVSAICHGYECIGTRVYRLRKNLSSQLLHLELKLWYDLHLPVFWKITGFHPHSGEGLFVSRGLLEKIGGFPEVLSEDIFTSFYAFAKGFKTCMLDAIILELAPKNLTSLMMQRTRWMRGTAQLMYYVLTSDLKFTQKIKIEFAFWLPFITSVGQILVCLTILDMLLVLIRIKSSFSLAILISCNQYIITLLGIIMFIVYMPKTFIDFISLINTVREWKLNPIVILLFPFYLFITALIALYALLTPFKSHWYKTERR